MDQFSTIVDSKHVYNGKCNQNLKIRKHFENTKRRHLELNQTP